MGKLLSFKNGYNAGKEQYGTGKRFINVLDIIENDYITHDRILGQVDIPPKDFEKNEVKFGDILFQRSSETREEVGQANVYLDQEKTATFGGFVIRGRPLSEFDPVFFNAMLKTAKARKDITSRSGGSTRYNIGQESLEAVFVSIAPTLPEQRKIADFLTAVDGRIQQLIRKRGLLEDYKKGVMQQLFTQAIRFKDDSGNDFPDWEEKKLGELGKFTGGGTPETGDDSYWSGSIPWVSSSDISESSITRIKIHRFITQAAIDESATKLVPANSILFISRVGVGKLAICAEEVCTSQDFTNFTPLRDNLTYLGYYFTFNQNLLKRYAQGTSIKGITSQELKKIAVSQPSLPEQTKIANFLSAIDRKIESVSTQITETQTFKRGLLQQMFV
jgi:type I restriction enzyme S subunit